jgi:tetratricopeptide (TPR) repeat protein
MTMKKITYVSLQYLLILFFLFPVPVWAKSARSLVESGNEAFLQGDYGASLENYEKAAQAEPDSAVVLFNKGDALYKQEKFAEALSVFEQAAAKALEKNDQGLEAQSRYNMGNSAYRRAEAYGRENPEKALDEYKKSSGYYQSAVKLNPDLSEAAHNLELSRIAAKQIENLLQKQQQQAKQQEQQKQDIAKDLENLQKEQQKAAEQSKELGQSRKEQQSTKGDTAEQLAENQKSITGKTRETADKLQQLDQEQKTEQSGYKAREHVKKAVEQQEKALKKLQENKPSEASRNQQEASRELQEALQQLQQDRNKGQENEGAGQEEAEKKDGAREQQKQQVQQQEQETAAEDTGQQNGEASQVSGTPASESPEEIINEEMEIRRDRSAKDAIGHKPVDKDW